MSATYEEVLQIWGRNILRKRGYKVNDDDTVSIDFDVTYEGCCEECQDCIAYVEISCGNSVALVGKYDFTDILLELVQASVENG